MRKKKTGPKPSMKHPRSKSIYMDRSTWSLVKQLTPGRKPDGRAKSWSYRIKEIVFSLFEDGE